MANARRTGPGPVRDRPRMPSSYGVDPSATGDMLAWDAVTDKLAASRNYWIVTTGGDGRPHAVPVWGVWLDGTLLFATDTASRKGRNIRRDGRVAVHLESGDDVVTLQGAAEVERDRDVLDRFADAYDAKYRLRPAVDDPGAPVYRVRPTVALAWIERDFPGTATRFRFLR